MRHVGFSERDVSYPCSLISTISARITRLLEGVHPEGKTLIVPDCSIRQMLDSVSSSYVPQNGSIYDGPASKNFSEQHVRYQSMSGGNTTLVSGQDFIPSPAVVDIVVESIVYQVKETYGIVSCNSRLTAWDTVLGDSNSKGLRSHAPLKLKHKRPKTMEFHMMY